MAKRKEVGTVRLSVVLDEKSWRELRSIAELERTGQGRASVNALLQRLVAEYLERRRKGGRHGSEG